MFAIKDNTSNLWTQTVTSVKILTGGSLLCLLSIVVEKVGCYKEPQSSDSRSEITLLVLPYIPAQIDSEIFH